MYLVGAYARLIGARVRSQVQYRTSFALQVAGAFLLSFTDFLAVLVLFQHMPTLSGWKLEEVAFLYGSSYLVFKLTDMAVGHLDQLGQVIQRGDFDMVMVRPLGALFQVVSSDFQLRHVGSMAQGVIVFAVALGRVDIHWTAGRVAVMLLMPFSGMLIFAGVWIVGATTTFWSVRSMEAVNAFTYGGNQLTTYPMHIYGSWLRRLVIFIIPLAFVNYLPSLYVLDKEDPLGLPPVLRFVSPIVALTVIMVARLIWNTGVRHYRSTGS